MALNMQDSTKSMLPLKNISELRKNFFYVYCHEPYGYREHSLAKIHKPITVFRGFVIEQQEPPKISMTIAKIRNYNHGNRTPSPVAKAQKSTTKTTKGIFVKFQQVNMLKIFFLFNEPL